MARAIKFGGTLNLPSIDFKKWKKDMDREATESLKVATVAFLDTAHRIIPVWSGASLGTFSELAAQVGFDLRIHPTSRSQELGLGIGAGVAASTGTFRTSPRAGKYEMKYNTSLEHLIFNENFNANEGGDPNVFAKLKNPGPYGFQDAAQSVIEPLLENTVIPEVTFKQQLRRIK